MRVKQLEKNRVEYTIWEMRYRYFVNDKDVTLWRNTNEFSLNNRNEMTAKKEMYWIQAFFKTADTVGVYLLSSDSRPIRCVRYKQVYNEYFNTKRQQG